MLLMCLMQLRLGCRMIQTVFSSLHLYFQMWLTSSPQFLAIWNGRQQVQKTLDLKVDQQNQRVNVARGRMATCMDGGGGLQARF